MTTGREDAGTGLALLTGILGQRVSTTGAPAPDAPPALLAPGAAPLSYAQLDAEVAAFTAMLGRSAIGRADRVAIVVPNGAAMAVAFLGTIAAAVAAPLNPAYTAEELDFYLRDLEPAAVVVGSDLDTPTRDVARSLGIRVIELYAATDVAGACTFDVAGPADDARSTRSAAPDELALLLHTSGTTSRPKLVPLSHGNLATSARNVAETLRLTGDDRCLNMMPLFHIHGLVAALLASLTSGGSVVCTPGFRAGHVLEWIGSLRPTWYTAVPSIHQAMVAAIDDTGGDTSFRLIRSSSAALPVAVLHDLERAFGAPVVEAYGMTEAAHQIASNPLPPGRRRPGTVGRAAGPEVAVLDATGAPVPAGSVGEIVIRGANVTSGYLAEPTVNEAAFHDGWLRTGDEGSIDEDGYIEISGRLKEIINRGGEKISPREVEEVLLTHPGVEQAAVFSVPHDRLGEDVGAAVVLADGAEVSKGQLRIFVSGHLAAFKVPRVFVFVDEIPLGATGKVQRVGLSQRLNIETRRTAAPGPRAEPRDETERRIVEVFAEVLELDEPIGATDDFFDLGADSMHLEELLDEIARAFGREVPASELLAGASPRQIAALLHPDHADDRSTTVLPIQPSGSRAPLFCLIRGEAVHAARHLSLVLGPDQPVFAIWAPTMHGSRAVGGTIEEIAAACVSAVQAVQPEGPYFLFGHSLGGIVVYEMGRQLAATEQRVGLVVLADAPYPVRPRWGRDLALPRLRVLFSRNGGAAVARRLRRAGRRTGDRVTERSDAQGPHEARPAPGSEELLDEAAAFQRQLEWARVRRPAGGPVLVLRTRSREPRGPFLGWDDVVTSDWEARRVPGSHRTILGEPHVFVVAEVLAEVLPRAQDGAPSAG